VTEAPVDTLQERIEAAPPVVDKSPPMEEITQNRGEAIHGKGFQLLRPNYSFQFAYSPSAFGHSDVSGGQGITVDGFSIGLDLEPAFLQFFGVIGFGPTFNLYPTLPVNPNVENTAYSIWSYGFELRYQARYFREQIVVPEAGWNYEHVSFNTLPLGNSTLTLSGPVAGVFVLLNPLEPSEAFNFYKDAGVLRTYFVAEVRKLQGTNASVSLGGTSLYFGLKLEF
jgi:hypothetical protein